MVALWRMGDDESWEGEDELGGDKSDRMRIRP